MKSIDAATQAFGDLSKLISEYNAYRNAPSIPGIRISQKNIPALSDIKVDILSPTEQALMWDKLLYVTNLAHSELASTAADVAKLAAAAPKDPNTLDLLWRTQLANHDIAAADQAADALLAIKPKDAQAPFGKGLIAMAKLENAKDFSASKWAAARQFIISANQSDNNNPEILFAYYQSFTRAQLPATQPAKLGLLRAFELEPQSFSIRLNLAASLVEDRRYAEARIVLKPAAFSIHDTRSATWAQKMLGTIESLKDGDPTPKTLPEIDKVDDGDAKPGKN